MKMRKEEQDRALKENTKLLNCIEIEERKLKTQRMKLSRLQSKVSLMFFISIWPVQHEILEITIISDAELFCLHLRL